MPYAGGKFVPVELITNYGGGANTRDLPEFIERNQSPFPLNVELIGSRFRKFPGFTHFGTDSDEGMPGWTLYNHRILSSEEVMVKTISTRLKFYDEVTETHHLLSSASFTADRRWWFDTFNGYLFGGNGVENLVRWRGSSWGKLQNAVLAGATEIDLQAGEGVLFATSGSGMIEGDTFAWTGKSTDQLTGVTGLTSNHAAGSRVIAELDSSTYSTQPKGSVGAIYKNRLFIRPDDAANTLYFSKLADNTSPQDDLANFTIAASGAGDAGFIIFPAAIRGVKKFLDGSNNAIFLALCADGEAYSVTVTDTAGSPGTTVGLFVPYKNLLADLAGENMVVSTENEIAVVDNFGTMRVMGYGEQSTAVKTERLSDSIATTTDPSLLDFSSGAFRYADRKLFALCRFTGDPYQNFGVIRDTDPNGFVFADCFTWNDIVEWKNRYYAIDSVTGKTYRLKDGRSADGAPIRARYPLPKLNHGVELIHKTARKIRVKGAMTPDCQLFLDLFYDSAVHPQTFVLEGDDTSVVDVNNPSVAMGTVIFGQVPLSGGISNPSDLRPFTATINLGTDRMFYHVLPVWRNEQADVDFEIHSQLHYAVIHDADVEIAGKQISIS